MGFFLEGPGLAIRVLCAEEPYMDKSFAETKILLKMIVNYAESCKKVNEYDYFNLIYYFKMYFIIF